MSSDNNATRFENTRNNHMSLAVSNLSDELTRVKDDNRQIKAQLEVNKRQMDAMAAALAQRPDVVAPPSTVALPTIYTKQQQKYVRVRKRERFS